MSKAKFAKEPLLFIHQENVMKPKAKMQDYFISKKIKTFDKKNKEEIQQLEIEALETTETSEIKKEVSQEEKGKEKKQFKDMTVKEKVEHLTNLSPYAPKMKCEVVTTNTNRTIRGVILELKEEIVYVHTGNRMNEIPLQEIKDIRIIGF